MDVENMNSVVSADDVVLIPNTQDDQQRLLPRFCNNYKKL